MQRVVIIGGGFSGAYCAKRLEKDYDVTLIDTKNYFEYTPGILRTLVDPSHMRSVQVLHGHYLKETELINGHVTRVNDKHVFMGKKKIPFHYLIISSGSSYALPIKELDVRKATRASELRDYYRKLKKAKRVLIIGGGLVGVELAAEIATHMPGKEVTIVQSKDNIIDRNHSKAIKYATKFLKEEGIRMIFGERVSSNKGKTYMTNKKRKIRTDMAFLCTGITPNSDFLLPHFKKRLSKRGFVKVNQYLQIEGHKKIFAVGDITDIMEEKTAQNAEKQACVVVKNIKCAMKKKCMKTYSSAKRPMLISLGKWKGIFQYRGFVLTGLIPALLKMYVEWRTMKRYS